MGLNEVMSVCHRVGLCEILVYALCQQHVAWMLRADPAYRRLCCHSPRYEGQSGAVGKVGFGGRSELESCSFPTQPISTEDLLCAGNFSRHLGSSSKKDKRSNFVVFSFQGNEMGCLQ